MDVSIWEFLEMPYNLFTHFSAIFAPFSLIFVSESVGIPFPVKTEPSRFALETNTQTPKNPLIAKEKVHNIAVVDLIGGDGGMPFMYTTPCTP